MLHCGRTVVAERREIMHMHGDILAGISSIASPLTTLDIETEFNTETTFP
jgi:hypothetical protein